MSTEGTRTNNLWRHLDLYAFFSSSDPPGPPTITGYETGEILLAGERRTLTCRVSGGNPRPWVLWYRDGRLVDDTTSEDEDGVFNSYEVTVTAEEDGAVYECSVTNDLLETPYTANATLTVYCKCV